MAVNSLLHPDSLFAKYAAGKRSSIICLTHNDLTRVDHHHLERITYGADVCELRVDLLDPHGPSVATSVPSAEYVIAQIDHLRKTSSLPILFTIRSVSQGGKFLDNAEEEARRLMLIAVEKGCEYIDVEITWPDNLISEVVRQKKNARIIASYHDWSGKVLWSGSALKEAYDRAIQYGGLPFIRLHL
jgi:pentafunctional AROM polypeptide